MMIDTIINACKALRDVKPQHIGTEHDMQRLIADAFDRHGITYEKEFKLGPRCRVDFMLDHGVAVEAKKGKPTSSKLEAQLERYTAFTEVHAIIAAVERSVFFIANELNEKRVYVVSFSSSWGIAI